MADYFAKELFLGVINKINTYNCFVKIPKPSLLKSFYFEKEQYCGGIIGKYVVVLSENLGFLGIIQEVSLPKNTDYSIEEIEIQNEDIFKTDCRIQLLLSFNYQNLEDDKVRAHSGIQEFPLVGSKIYICHSDLLSKILNGINKDENPSIEIGKVISNEIPLNVSFSDLFVRHCAIVGTTGGGKSYTIGKIIEEIHKHNDLHTKKLNVILFDATGEFESLGAERDNSNNDSKFIGIKRYKFGKLSEENKKNKLESVYFSYKSFSTSDWFALFNPSANVQAIKLREAIKSLKLVYAKKQKDQQYPDLYEKANNLINDFNKALKEEHDVVYNDESSDFEIKNLAKQISNECIWPTNKAQDKKGCFGGNNEQDEGYCSALINKINYKVGNKIYNQIFNFYNNLNDSKNIAEVFSINDNDTIKIISLKDVSFDDNMRAVLMNCIGRFFLDKARKEDYKENPTILIIDEAHQFLNTRISGDYAPDVHLNAFDNIAKECRKHGLYLCLSTQMPRDIPDGTLSQVGTFIVHRLINENDKNKIKDACQESTREIMSYLPILGKGECMIISNHVPMPLHIKVNEPSDEFRPSSKSPLEEHFEDKKI